MVWVIRDILPISVLCHRINRSASRFRVPCSTSGTWLIPAMWSWVAHTLWLWITLTPLLRVTPTLGSRPVVWPALLREHDGQQLPLPLLRDRDPLFRGGTCSRNRRHEESTLLYSESGIFTLFKGWLVLFYSKNGGVSHGFWSGKMIFSSFSSFSVV